MERSVSALWDHEVIQDSNRTAMVPASAIGINLILHTLLAFWSIAQVYATLTNITIDDTNSTFWSWVGTWNVVTPSTPCHECFAKPDPDLVYNSTWHDGPLRSGAFTFQGAAVYIYGIDVVNPGNISFAMSNPSTTGFHYYGGSGYVYNSLFFSASNLDSTVQHTVTWLIEASSVGGRSALFDYAVVTLSQPDPSSSIPNSNTNSAGRQTLSGSTPSTAPSGNMTSAASPAAPENSHRPKTAAIVGAVVGAVGGLALFSAVFIFLRHWRVAATNYSIEPYPPTERVSSPLAPALVQHGPFFSGKSSLPRSVPSPSVSTATAAVVMASAPVPSRTLPVNSNFRVPHAPGEMALARDPHHLDGGRGDLEMEVRLRHLEDLAAVQASRPPSYH
ncbi:hypothetical protein B0H11DRAFT_2355684 [Mycena galericulata]|nr:hypothetical protein B0H11DRAFT_2355684 [Mycena galericulata]